MKNRASTATERHETATTDSVYAKEGNKAKGFVLHQAANCRHN